MHSSPEARKRKIAAAYSVSAATLICLFGHLGAIGLVGPDEPRYAWIARVMAQSSDWITPRLYGSPWFEKPILYYWLAAIGFRLHFPAEWAARLPSAFAALAATSAIAWLAWKHYGENKYCPWSPTLLAPLFFATSVAAIGFSRAATPDMVFAASITLAMASAATVLRFRGALRYSQAAPTASPRHDVAPLILFGAFLGLAVLAKGPAGIILAAGAIGIWALAAAHVRIAIRLLHPLAILSFCAVALPWYIVCAMRNSDFVHVFIFQHNVERYLTPIFQHRQPFWFFIPITLLAAIPWLAFLVPAISDGRQSWRETSWRDSSAFFFACWAFFPISFFSFSQSKLPSYILPAMPAFALVLAISAARVIEDNLPKYRWTFALLGSTWMALAIAAFIWLHRLPRSLADEVHAPIFACCTLAILGGIAIAFLARSRQRAAIWISLSLICVLMEVAGNAVLPKLDPLYSARDAGTMLRGDLRPDRLFEWELPRSWHFGLAFYLNRELPAWNPDDRGAALVLTTAKTCEQLRTQSLTAVDCSNSSGMVLVPVLARSR